MSDRIRRIENAGRLCREPPDLAYSLRCSHGQSCHPHEPRIIGYRTDGTLIRPSAPRYFRPLREEEVESPMIVPSPGSRPNLLNEIEIILAERDIAEHDDDST